MNCFISGGITNVPDYMERFAEAEDEVRSLGLSPFNPAAMSKPLLDAGVALSDEGWLEIDFVALRQCDALYHLDNWLGSSGAGKEHQVAMVYGIPIFYQQNLMLYRSSGLMGESLVEAQLKKPARSAEVEADKLLPFRDTCLDCKYATKRLYETGSLDDVEYRCTLLGNALIYDDLHPMTEYDYPDLKDCPIGRFEKGSPIYV